VGHVLTPPKNEIKIFPVVNRSLMLYIAKKIMNGNGNGVQGVNLRK